MPYPRRNSSSKDSAVAVGVLRTVVPRSSRRAMSQCAILFDIAAGASHLLPGTNESEGRQAQATWVCSLYKLFLLQ